MNNIRLPAVAGSFYPSDPHILNATLTNLLNSANSTGDIPKAIIAPHAGYIYSGPIAANVYALLVRNREIFQRVILLGPTHRVAFSGLALSSADFFLTPLGKIPVDSNAQKLLAGLPQVLTLDQAHAQEHSLEVQLPFLQRVLGNFSLVPLVVGNANSEMVAEVIERLWGGPETLIVISSDLSHYHDYATAQRLDAATSQAIEQLLPDAIQPDHACGRNPIKGLLTVARQRGMKVKVIDVRNSGDTAGSRDRVVGYGAYTFH